MLSKYVLGKPTSIDLSRGEYDGIVAAKRHVLEYLALEYLFNLLLENYEEFELELLSVTLKYATYFGQDEWAGPADVLQLIARRFANMLTTAHGYCDQAPHIISTRYGSGSPKVSTAKEYFRYEHSAVLGYRVCVELRRFMQHRGSAIDSALQRSAWVERPDGRRFRTYAIEPEVNLRKLAEDPKVKRPVLAEMEPGSRKKITGDLARDVRIFVRDYISALGRVHLKIRDLLREDIEADDSVILGTVERYREISEDGSVVGLAVMELTEQGLIEDRSPTFVLAEPIERRRLLISRNHLPTHFDTQVITNEIEPRP